MPRHPPIALTTLDRSHCQCSSLVWFSKPILFARAQRGAEPDHPGKPEFAAMDHVRLTIMRTQTDTVTFYNRVQNDAIDVFNRSALLELRRAARLQPVIRPASRDQIRCRAVRQRQSDRASDAIPKNGEQRTIQSDRLPTYLQSLTHLRPARPSKGSSGKGSDAPSFRPEHLEASRSIFSSQCRQNRHQAIRPMQTLFLQRIFCLALSTPSALVELSGIEPLTPCLQSRCSPS
jgi:hypothetical protein